jgi:serine/threonine-protein kinase
MRTEASSNASDPLAVGDRLLDRYVVVERLEAGGTSVVYRGEDERLKRPVCIKVFHTVGKQDRISRMAYEHFVQEAFALSKLTHPNTLRIYDFAHLPGPDGDDGPPFQISEFMTGGTLSSRLVDEGPLSWEEAVRITTSLCGALEEAHHHGIIHRDIKPKNILFGATSHREPKLADFGIAKALKYETLANAAGDTQVVAGRRLIMFSGLWAAPEQLAGKPVTAATDIYSLALVVVYMLTGRCVFSTNDPVEAYRQRSELEDHLDRVLDAFEFPPELGELLKLSCAYDQELRPKDANAFASAFAAAMSRISPAPRPVTHAPIQPILRPVPDPSTDSSPVVSGPPMRIPISAAAQSVGDRMAYFVATSDDSADLECAKGAVRIRVSLVPAANGFAVHIKGLNCFVKRANGRPSGATQLTESGRIELVTASQSLIAGAEVQFGSAAAGHLVYPVGNESVAVSRASCSQLIALDFGSGAECMFVYTPIQGRLH